MSDDIVSLTNHLNQCLMSGIDVHKRRKSFFFSLCVRGTLGFMDRALHNQYELTTGKATRIYMTPKSATELRDFCTIDGEEVFRMAM